MNNLLGEHSVMHGGRSVGTLTVSQSGLMTTFECVCDYDSEDVLRLANAVDGEYTHIGVVMPDGGQMRLRKSFTKSALEGLRLNPNAGFALIKRGEKPQAATEQGPTLQEPPQEDTVPPEPQEEPQEKLQESIEETPEPEIKPTARITLEARDNTWRVAENPAELFRDQDIAEACKTASGALTAERDGFTLLAIPVSQETPFPMMPVFCFGESEIIGGREYIVFKAKDGNLSL